MGEVKIIELELDISIDDMDSTLKENSIFVRYTDYVRFDYPSVIVTIQRYYKGKILWNFYPNSSQIIFDKDGRVCLPIHDDEVLFLQTLTEIHSDLPEDLEFFLWHPEVFRGYFYEK
jgi:hypothetical protein